MIRKERRQPRTRWNLRAELVALVIICAAGCAMPSESWTDITFDDVLTFRSPVPLAPTGGRGIDSNAGSWEGAGVSVLVDHGPFADPLIRYADRPDYRTFTETVHGHPARIVSFSNPDGNRVVAIHFAELERPPGGGRPSKLTMVVEGTGSLDDETLLEVVRSITFLDRDAAPSDSS